MSIDTLLTARLRAHTTLPLSYHKGALRIPPSLSYETYQEKRYHDWRHSFEADHLDGNKLLYYTYRTVCHRNHQRVFAQGHIHYDLTVLVATAIGNEPNRTVGHLHSLITSSGVRPPELYEVISGSALFIFQPVHEKKIYTLRAKTGDIIPVPGTWGHITVNASARRPLIISNLFWTDAPASDYNFFENTSGPAWYPHGHGSRISFHKNYHQKKMYQHIWLARPALPQGIIRGIPLYRQYQRHPDAFSFLIPTSHHHSSHLTDCYTLHHA